MRLFSKKGSVTNRSISRYAAGTQEVHLFSIQSGFVPVQVKLIVIFSPASLLERPAIRYLHAPDISWKCYSYNGLLFFRDRRLDFNSERLGPPDTITITL